MASHFMVKISGAALPPRTIREIIASSVDIIVQAQRLRDGSRRITHITEVLGMEGDVLTTQDLLVYEIQGEDEDGNLIGRHKSTGISRPKVWERAKYYNVGDQLTEALRAAEVDEWAAE